MSERIFGVKKELISLVHENGCLIRHGEDLRINPFIYMEVLLKEAYGVFASQVDTNSIFIFWEKIQQDHVDYIIAHEFGHFMSHKLKHGVHELKAKEQTSHLSRDEIFLLLNEEEFRADMFATEIAKRFNFSTPLFCFLRNSEYEVSIPKLTRTILMEEVHEMLSALQSFSSANVA